MTDYHTRVRFHRKSIKLLSLCAQGRNSKAAAKVSSGEERNDELRSRVFWKSTYNGEIRCRVSNVVNTYFFATRFARCSARRCSR